MKVGLTAFKIIKLAYPEPGTGGRQAAPPNYITRNT